MMWMVLVVMTMLNLITMGSVLGPLLGYEHCIGVVGGW